MVSDSQPQFGMVVRPDVMVPMRDGVRLATDLYFPARNNTPVEKPLQFPRRDRPDGSVVDQTSAPASDLG